jgi:4-amino-4-deoxy-L-arabinose transferase-like glycosyltransferase
VIGIADTMAGGVVASRRRAASLMIAINQLESSAPTRSAAARVPVRNRTMVLGAIAAVVALYLINVWFCARSAAFYMPYAYLSSDMHANLLWAESISKQGWLNPSPYHPYLDWMERVGKYEEWERWWQTPKIFQQSPLYAYVLAGFRAFSEDLLYPILFQAALAVALCGCLGRITARISGNNKAGWIAFGVAGLYAPFHLYSTMILRDMLAFFIAGALLLVLVELQQEAASPRARRWLSAGAGLLLGLGFLTRESFFLIVPMVWAMGGWLLWRRNEKLNAALVVGLTVLTLSPLFIRNAVVGAPLLSSSNRFPEAFIQGHARGTMAWGLVIPNESRQILERSQGRSLAVVRETLATHDHPGTWLKLMGAKLLMLLDPFEMPDNVSFYFMERISPVIRFGLEYWMIVVPGIGGLIMGLLKRDQRHLWLWLLLPTLIAGVILGVALSRYRQILAVLWIPWAGYFLFQIWLQARENWRRAAMLVGACVAGWLMVLGPLSRVPREYYERRAEYFIAAKIYDSMQQPEKAAEMRAILQQYFPASK